MEFLHSIYLQKCYNKVNNRGGNANERINLY